MLTVGEWCVTCDYTQTRTSITIPMNIPPELLDEIFSYLPSDDHLLRNYSLVAKSWVDPSRRRLFETVVIAEGNRQSWLKRIASTNIELLRHVRSLSIVCSRSTTGLDPRRRVNPSSYIGIDDLYDYFPSFHQLRIIEFSGSFFTSDIPERMEMFSPCQYSLSSLTLAGVFLPWRSFIALIDYFPNLRNIKLWSISFEDTDTNPPPLSRPLRGKLCLYLSDAENLAALSNWFTGLEVECEELMLDMGGHEPNAHFQRIVAVCGKTLRRLKIAQRECLPSWPILRTLANPTSK